MWVLANALVKKLISQKKGEAEKKARHDEWKHTVEQRVDSVGTAQVQFGPLYWCKLLVVEFSVCEWL